MRFSLGGKRNANHNGKMESIILKFTILILQGIKKDGERKWYKLKASATQDQYGNRSQDVFQKHLLVDKQRQLKRRMDDSRKQVCFLAQKGNL